MLSAVGSNSALSPKIKEIHSNALSMIKIQYDK